MAHTANISQHTANSKKPSKRVLATSGRATAPMQAVNTSASQLPKRDSGSVAAATSSRTAPHKRPRYSTSGTQAAPNSGRSTPIVPIKKPAKSQSTRSSSAPAKAATKKPAKTATAPNTTATKAKPRSFSQRAQKAPKVQQTPKAQKVSIPFSLTSKFIVVTIVCVLAIVALYPTSRDYYITVRERDRLAAEFQVLAARNEVIHREIATLNTNEGIEDHARAQFGWVKAGENAMTVTDIGEIADTTSLPDQVIAGSVEASETWLTKILDVVFFID